MFQYGFVLGSHSYNDPYKQVALAACKRSKYEHNVMEL